MAPPNAPMAHQRRDTIDAFAFDPQRLSAGRQHGRARTNAHHRFHQLGRRIDDVLAIVEDQEEPLSSDGPSDGLGGNLDAAELEAKDARDHGRHQIGIGQRGQLDQPSVAPKGREQGAGDFQRERAFADSTGPGQRDHSIGRQKIQQTLHRSGVGTPGGPTSTAQQLFPLTRSAPTPCVGPA